MKEVIILFILDVGITVLVNVGITVLVNERALEQPNISRSLKPSMLANPALDPILE